MLTKVIAEFILRLHCILTTRICCFFVNILYCLLFIVIKNSILYVYSCKSVQYIFNTKSITSIFCKHYILPDSAREENEESTQIYLAR